MVIQDWLVKFVRHAHKQGINHFSGYGRRSPKRKFRAIGEQTPAMVEVLEPRQMLTDFWATTEGLAILANLNTAETNYQSALSTSA